MLISLREVTGYEMHSRDGKIGIASDFLFDQKSWFIKSIVDKSGKVFSKELLFSAGSIGGLDMQEKILHMDLDNEQIKHSPRLTVRDVLNPERFLPMDDNKVVFHSDWLNNWNSMRLTVLGKQKKYATTKILNSSDLLHQEAMKDASLFVRNDDEEIPTLQSSAMTFGFKISSRNGDMGYMQDFIVNDEDWSIKFLVINTKRNFSGKKILVSPEAIDWISWRRKHVSVDMEKEKLAGCPHFDMSFPLNPELQSAIQEKYECHQYWAG